MIITTKTQTESIVQTNNGPSSEFSYAIYFDDGSSEFVQKDTFDFFNVGDDVDMVVQLVPSKKSVTAIKVM